MGRKVRRGVAGHTANLALAAAIVIAPVAGGSSDRIMVPILFGIAAVAYVASLIGGRQAGRKLHVFGLPVALGVLGLFTLAQAAPMPSGLLSALSGRAYEVRTFVTDAPAWWPLSYEPDRTAAEAAKLFTYALIAVAAHERARAFRGPRVVVQVVLTSVIATIVLGQVHRLLGMEDILGLIDAASPAFTLLTTFVNPNHAAGYCAWGALLAFGIAFDHDHRAAKVGYTLVGLGCVAVSILNYSRGGLVALAVGLLGFFALQAWSQRSAGSGRTALASLIAIASVGAFVALWQQDRLSHAFATRPDDPLGVSGKLAAMGDAWPLILDHPWFGIGRGSYESVYTAYKSSGVQYTFTHPENIAIQLASDWGLAVGGAALLAMIVAAVRRLAGVEDATTRAALVGVLAIGLHNLVDFSLELPGTALPVAAVMGATTYRVLKTKRIDTIGWRNATFALLVAIIPGTFATFLAVRNPTLAQDLATLAEDADADAAARHPANAIVAARMSYAYETAKPPELKAAILWANRALLLAPTYADAHLVAGRLLIRAGARNQGFVSLRKAWALVEEPRANEMVAQIVALARDPSEVREAVPRRDIVYDVPDERALARAAAALAGTNKDWARSMLEGIDDLTPVSEWALEPLASAALAIDMDGLTERAANARRAKDPTHARSYHLLIEVYRRRHDDAGIQRLIDEAVAQPKLDPSPFLRLRVDTALRQKNIPLAREALAHLARTMPPTLDNQVALARKKAAIERMDSNLTGALTQLRAAVDLAPGDAALRLERADLLIELGRADAARADVAFVVRMNPSHAAAKALLKRLDQPR